MPITLNNCNFGTSAAYARCCACGRQSAVLLVGQINMQIGAQQCECGSTRYESEIGARTPPEWYRGPKIDAETPEWHGKP